jgi:hypothetical protein
MAEFTVEFTRILFFEDTFEADDEGTARELATAQADSYMVKSSSEWDSFNDSIRAWRTS